MAQGEWLLKSSTGQVPSATSQLRPNKGRENSKVPTVCGKGCTSAATFLTSTPLRLNRNTAASNSSTPGQPSSASRRSPAKIEPSPVKAIAKANHRSEEHTSELQSRENLVCRLLLEKKKHNVKD